MQILNFKNSRGNLNLTQKDLAKLFNVNNSTVSGWETGNDTIPLKRLIKYANKFHYSLDYLFGLSNINKFKSQFQINLKIIGIKLRKTRKDNKLTLESVAKKLNTSKSTIYAYEKGENLISTSFLFGLSKIYENFSIDELFETNNT